MSKGVLFLAENNEEIDYISIAKANSLMVKHHLNIPTAIVSSSNQKDLRFYFDEVILIEEQEVSQRKQYVGYNKRETLTWKNKNRTDVYDLTPFDETLLLDVDYLVLDDSLNFVWNNKEPLMMNRQTKNLLFENLHLSDRRLQDTTIPIYWATAVYFRKSELCKHFFKLAKFVEQNFTYFCRRYFTKAGLYRNDFAFSIAAHMIGDFSDYIKPLPNEILLTSLPKDRIVKVRKGSIEMLANWNGKYNPVSISQNVHIMNKFDLTKFSKELIRLYG